MMCFLNVFSATLKQRLRRAWSWIILLLIPCLIIGIHMALPEDSVTAPVHVGVALPDDGGEELWELLDAHSGTVLTFIRANIDTIDRNIAAGRWDCGVIVDEDFTELLEDMDTDRIFTLRVGGGSTVYPLVRETVSACMAALVTQPIAKDYLEDVGITPDPERLSQVLGAEDRVNISMHTADGAQLQPFELGGRGVQKILSWVISAMILVWLLLASHDLGRWSRSGAAKRMLPLRSFTLLICGRMAADWLLIAVPACVAMIGIGSGVHGCDAVIGYSLLWGAVGIILARFPVLWQNTPTIPPFAVVISLFLSGALLDMTALFPALSGISSRLPASIYLQICNGDIAAMLPLLAGAALLMLLSITLDLIRKCRI